LNSAQYEAKYRVAPQKIAARRRSSYLSTGYLGMLASRIHGGENQACRTDVGAHTAGIGTASKYQSAALGNKQLVIARRSFDVETRLK